MDQQPYKDGERVWIVFDERAADGDTGAGGRG